MKILHKLFEVATSQVIYQIASIPTSFKCQLVKYNPTASRKETEEFKLSIDELTVSQEDLFGDVISQDNADINNTVETAYNNTTIVDPAKDCDLRSIVAEQLYGPHGVLISNAYYDFSIAEKNITYNVDAIYPGNEERVHWIYSFWFKTKEDIEIENGKIYSLKVYFKDKNYWYFTISSSLHLELGDEVTILRGNMIKVTGTIVELNCECGYGLQIKYSDIRRANKKLTDWYTFNNLSIYKHMPINLLTGYNNEDQIIRIQYIQSTNKLVFKVNNIAKTFTLPLLDLNYWTYVMFDISNNDVRLISSCIRNTAKNKVVDELLYDTHEQITLNNFEITRFRIESMKTGLLIRNIRLYENEFEAGDTYIKDMYAPITQNASKLILVDSPNVPKYATFDSPVR